MLSKVRLEPATEELQPIPLSEILSRSTGADTIAKWNALMHFSNTKVEAFIGGKFRRVVSILPNAEGGMKFEYLGKNNLVKCKNVSWNYRFCISREGEE